ncbi:MAG: GTP 3',8-cyclase MoaA [Acidimicrobiales bacterium]
MTSVPVAVTRRARSSPVGQGDRLVDSFGRVHRDLRISITDRCNLRCVYCMPEEGMEFLPRTKILSYEELARVASVARSLGVERVRVTGGEPLVRRGVVSFVGMLAEIGFTDLSMTTNATGLVRLAQRLADAGLDRLNVSCDSLRPGRFSKIRRLGDLESVLQGMDAAERAGLKPLKVNVVVMAGVNDDEIVDFASFARRTGRVVRFIEYMPLDGAGRWQREAVVPAARILDTIGSVFELEPLDALASDPSAPATRYRFRDGQGEIGVIPTVTEPFCGSCDRLRITADGAVRNCLFATSETSLRDLMRAGASDSQIGSALMGSVHAKLPGHGINDPGFLRPRRSMSMIGG